MNDDCLEVDVMNLRICGSRSVMMIIDHIDRGDGSFFGGVALVGSLKLRNPFNTPWT